MCLEGSVIKLKNNLYFKYFYHISNEKSDTTNTIPEQHD